MKQKSKSGFHGLRPLADEVGRLIRPSLGKKRDGVAQIYLNWRRIVGAETAARCRPVKISYPRGKASGGTLTLSVTPAAALLVEYETPQICQRINQFLGFQAVQGIRLYQGLTTAALPAQNFAASTAKKPLVSDDDPRLDIIQDSALKEALRNFANVLS